MYWSELRPDEAGRTVVCSHKLGDCKFTTLTPKGFNCRTRVHEYGGGAYLIYNKIIYFSNLPDHRMYCQESNPNSVPVAITTGDKEWRYADGEMARDGLIVCVREDHDIVNRGEANEAQSTIVSINPKTKEQFVIVSLMCYLGDGNLTFEGGGGVEGLLSTRIVFLTNINQSRCFFSSQNVVHDAEHIEHKLLFPCFECCKKIFQNLQTHTGSSD